MYTLMYLVMCLEWVQHMYLDKDELGTDNESVNSLYATEDKTCYICCVMVRIVNPVFMDTYTYIVYHWVVELNIVAETVRWDDLQKFIYGKQLLKGADKLFVRGAVGIKIWNSLKTALFEEFGKKLSEVHRTFRNRRKKMKVCTNIYTPSYKSVSQYRSMK